MQTGELRQGNNLAYTKINNQIPDENGNFIINATTVGLESFEGLTPQTLPTSNNVQEELEGKQETLISGTNIKTLNGETLLGSGDISIDTENVGVQNFTIVGGDIDNYTGLLSTIISGVNSVTAYPTTLRSNKGNVVTTPSQKSFDSSSLPDGEYEIFYDIDSEEYEIYQSTIISPSYLNFQVTTGYKRLWVDNSLFPVSYVFYNGATTNKDMEIYPPLGKFIVKNGEVEYKLTKSYQIYDTLTYAPYGTKYPQNFDPNPILAGYGINIDDNNNEIAIKDELVKMSLLDNVTTSAPYLTDSNTSADGFYTMFAESGDYEYEVGTDFYNVDSPVTEFDSFGGISFTFKTEIKVVELQIRNGATSFDAYSLYGTNLAGNSEAILTETENVNKGVGEVWSIQLDTTKEYYDYYFEFYSNTGIFEIHKFSPIYLRTMGTDVLVSEQVSINNGLIKDIKVPSVEQSTGNSTENTISQAVITQLLNDKVTIEENKGLSTNDFTTEEKTKLESLSNTIVVQEVGESTTDVMSQASVSSLLGSKVSSEVGMGLSQNSYTTEEKTKLGLLFNYDDTSVRGLITNLDTIKADKATTYTKLEVDSKLSSALIYKGTLDTFAELDTIIDPKVGDMYNVIEMATNYAWNGTVWGIIGGVVDLSPYATTEVVNALRAELIAMIDLKLDKATLISLDTQAEYDALTAEEKTSKIAFIDEV